MFMVVIMVAVVVMAVQCLHVRLLVVLRILEVHGSVRVIVTIGGDPVVEQGSLPVDNALFILTRCSGLACRALLRARPSSLPA